jgi:hypothetical protein
MTSRNSLGPPGLLMRMASTRWRHGSWATPPLTAWALWITALVMHAVQHLVQFSPWWIVAATVLGAAVAATIAHIHMETPRQAKTAAWYAGLVVLVAGGWLALSVWNTPDRQVMPVETGWLVLAAIVLGPWYGLLRKHKRIALELLREEKRRAAQEHRAIRDQSDWAAIMAAANFPGMTVFDKTDTPAGFTVTMERSPKSRATFTQFKSAEALISLAAAQRLRHRGYVLAENAVTVERCPEAWLIKLHVRTQNVLTKTISLPNNHQYAGSINEGIEIGMYEDGTPIILRLVGKHLEIVGMTGSGKSALVNCLISQLSRCNDVVLWIGAVDKLLPLVNPWCRPWWQRLVPQPVFDWIAGQRMAEVLKMLAGAYQLIDLRSKTPREDDKITPSPAVPALVLILEESSSALNAQGGTGRRTPKVRCHTGEELNASQLVNRITRLGRSEGVIVIRVDQFALVGTAGEDGPLIKRNTELRICLKTMSEYDGRAVLGNGANVDTTQITDNALYARLVDGARPMAGKSYYADAKSEIPAFAVQHTQFQTALEPYVEVGLGQNYAGRWDDDRMSDLIDYKDGLASMRAAGSIAAVSAPTSIGGSMSETEDDQQGGSTNLFGASPDFGAFMRDALSKRGIDPTYDPNKNPNGESGAPGQDGRVDGPGEQIDFEAKFAEITREIGQIGDISHETQSPGEGTEFGVTTPEPLGAIIRAFVDREGGYVATADLARAIGWVGEDATDRELTNAATRLGQTLRRGPFHIPSRRERRPEYGGEAVRGYFLEELRIAADEVRHGVRKPPSTDE